MELCYTNVLDFDINNAEAVGNIEDMVFSNDYIYIHDMSDNFNRGFKHLNDENSFEINKLYKVAADKTVSIVN